MLYEVITFVIAVASRRDEKLRLSKFSKNNPTFHSNESFDVPGRITSYNVCYTKLLRFLWDAVIKTCESEGAGTDAQAHLKVYFETNNKQVILMFQRVIWLMIKSC